MSIRALVTGGARGIGRAISSSLVEAGFDVIILDKISPEDIKCDFIQVDLSDENATNNALELSLQKGDITRLVNNVGIVSPAYLRDSTTLDFASVMNINVKTAILCAKALLPGMESRKFGRIVNIASRTVLGKPLRTNYSASKGALISLSRTWALELAEYGVTSNTVCPGPIATELYTQANPSDSQRTRSSLANIPLGRIGTPDDVAAAVMFFLGNEAAFITGQTLHVCGGSSVGRNDF